MQQLQGMTLVLKTSLPADGETTDLSTEAQAAAHARPGRLLECGACEAVAAATALPVGVVALPARSTPSHDLLERWGRQSARWERR